MVPASGMNSGMSPSPPLTTNRSPYGPYSWGFIGCSNTHDTLWGYHDTSVKHMFWPASFPNDGDPHNVGGYGYPLDGQTLLKWSDPTNPAFNANWSKFDRMTDVYNPGGDPPLVWVQLCENINPGDGNYHVSVYSEVQSLLSILAQHAPTSVVYISPMHTYE